MSNTVFTTDELEMPCPECKGKGEIVSHGKSTSCTKCEGKGVIMTGLGQTLLHFVKKHL
ncbi:anti-TRAP (tryptophan RNA-binding attenuator protein) protein [Scopulibacillus darangshiensis]|uniref:Anti-TRAP (Tryptophan RNA-binding attenuator protein) protein n=1 Tax=Scopulibacillus darangshiensis TaxID=442528 RepID=A0A4R2NPX8_9BACL|nr:tryptophan RNA-binding attenuation protein [Scopulibacillus darangshiensis]TCP23732.1 anti-TRAP (tryptophan RNA-binding attenuator protein) protein [Scopulibacillus darangshiensis]